MDILTSDDLQEYVDQIFDRTHKVVNLNIWDPVSKQRLKAWIDCLELHDAKLLGAYLLDNFCCRSELQFLSMLDVLFYDLEMDFENQNLSDVLQKAPKFKLRDSLKIAPVIGLHQPPTKSGPYVLRLIQRRFRVDSGWLAWPYHLGDLSKIKHLYFVDDFCGTGKQFIKFADSINLDQISKNHPDIKITYLVATIHEKGISEIREQKPYVNLKFAERLSNSNQVLSDSCFARYKVPGFKDAVLSQYENVLNKAKLPRTGPLHDGFGDLGLAYAFSHATPNNTLPIFWYETSNWTPLLNR